MESSTQRVGYFIILVNGYSDSRIIIEFDSNNYMIIMV